MNRRQIQRDPCAAVDSSSAVRRTQHPVCPVARHPHHHQIHHETQKHFWQPIAFTGPTHREYDKHSYVSFPTKQETPSPYPRCNPCHQPHRMDVPWTVALRPANLNRAYTPLAPSTATNKVPQARPSLVPHTECTPASYT